MAWSEVDDIEPHVGRDEVIERIEGAVGVPEREIRHEGIAARLAHLTGVGEAPVGVAVDPRHHEGVVQRRVEGRDLIVLIRRRVHRDRVQPGVPGGHGGGVVGAEVPRGHLRRQVRRRPVEGDEGEAHLGLDVLAVGHAEIQPHAHVRPGRRGGAVGEHRVALPYVRRGPRLVEGHHEVQGEAARHSSVRLDAALDRLPVGHQRQRPVGVIGAVVGLGDPVVEVDDQRPRGRGRGKLVDLVRRVRRCRELGLNAALERDAVEARGRHLIAGRERGGVLLDPQLRGHEGGHRQDAQHAVVLRAGPVEVEVREGQDRGVAGPVAVVVKEVDRRVLARGLRSHPRHPVGHAGGGRGVACGEGVAAAAHARLGIGRRGLALGIDVGRGRVGDRHGSGRRGRRVGGGLAAASRAQQDEGGHPKAGAPLPELARVRHSHLAAESILRSAAGIQGPSEVYGFEGGEANAASAGRAPS